MKRMLLLLFIFCKLRIYLSQPISSCPITETEVKRLQGNGIENCYAYFETSTSPSLARKRCRTFFNGFLARINDTGELDKVVSNIKVNTANIIVDIVCRPDEPCIWSDGTTLSSEMMARLSDPITTRCGALNGNSEPRYTQWSTINCETHHHFICQTLAVIKDEEKCGVDSYVYDNNCYKLSPENLSYNAAKSLCRSEGGVLTDLKSQESIIALVNYLQESGITNDIWAGSVRVETGNQLPPSVTQDAREGIYITKDNVEDNLLDEHTDWRWSVDDQVLARGLCQYNPTPKPVVGVTTEPVTGIPSNETTASTSTAAVIAANNSSDVIVIVVSICILLIVIICVVLAIRKFRRPPRKQSGNSVLYNAADELQPNSRRESNVGYLEPISGRPPIAVPTISCQHNYSQIPSLSIENIYSTIGTSNQQPDSLNVEGQDDSYSRISFPENHSPHPSETDVEVSPFHTQIKTENSDKNYSKINPSNRSSQVEDSGSEANKNLIPEVSYAELDVESANSDVEDNIETELCKSAISLNYAELNLHDEDERYRNDHDLNESYQAIAMGQKKPDLALVKDWVEPFLMRSDGDSYYNNNRYALYARVVNLQRSIQAREIEIRQALDSLDTRLDTLQERVRTSRVAHENLMVELQDLENVVQRYREQLVARNAELRNELLRQ